MRDSARVPRQQGNDLTDSSGATGARTILIDPVDPVRATRGWEAALDEATGLCHAIDLNVIHAESLRLDRPKPATLIGGG